MSSEHFRENTVSNSHLPWPQTVLGMAGLR